jgi:hypothetical protein
MERDRGGHLDHESIGEIRRTLSGMQHDAAEGHRLLHEAYERDGSLGPIQVLSTFSESHRDTWGALRDRLPVQLGDVSQQVSSVFDAIDQEVAPLQSLLPQPPSQGGSGRHQEPGQDSTGSSNTNGPAPSTTGGSPTGSHSGSGKPQPSTSVTGGDGLLGGNTGGLLDPPMDSASSSPSSSRSPSSGPNVTLPPLLPGLLPGLGIDGEESN